MEYLSADKHNAAADLSKSASRPNAKGKRVVVIGGGDTGCDCIATALREGATSVVAFEILPEPAKNRQSSDNPWPQWPRVFRIDYGHEEVRLRTGGTDPRMYCVSSKRFVADESGSAVAAIETVKVEWTKNEKGQWNMSTLEGSEEMVPADLVLLAMGFLGPEKPLLVIRIFSHVEIVNSLNFSVFRMKSKLLATNGSTTF